MKVALTPEIGVRLEQLRAEVARLEALHTKGIEFEVDDGFAALRESEKLEILENTLQQLTPDAIRELLAFTVEMCAVCQSIGAMPNEPLTVFVRHLAAMAKRSRSVGAH